MLHCRFAIQGPMKKEKVTLILHSNSAIDLMQDDFMGRGFEGTRTSGDLRPCSPPHRVHEQSSG